MVAVVALAGFCEESVFRGYLQEPCRRLTGALPPAYWKHRCAVVMQALIFGAAHGFGLGTDADDFLHFIVVRGGRLAGTRILQQ